MKSYVKRYPVLTYFFLTYVITWTCWITVFLMFEPYRASPESVPTILLIILECSESLAEELLLDLAT